jgi:hypothetical protein
MTAPPTSPYLVLRPASPSDLPAIQTPTLMMAAPAGGEA